MRHPQAPIASWRQGIHWFCTASRVARSAGEVTGDLRLDAESLLSASCRAHSGTVPHRGASHAVQEVLGYIAVLLALRPKPKPRAGAVLSTVQQGGTESRIAALESQAQAVVLQLDVRMEAPVITMPRSSDSDDKASPPEAPPLHLVQPELPSQDNRPHMFTISPGSHSEQREIL